VKTITITLKLEQTSVTWEFKNALKGLSRTEKSALINMIQMTGIEVITTQDNYGERNPNTIYLMMKSDMPIDVPKKTLEVLRNMAKVFNKLDDVRELGEEFNGVVKK